jgi:hypothetical protein
MPYADPERKRANDKAWRATNRDRIRQRRAASRPQINRRRRESYARRRDEISQASTQGLAALDARWAATLWRKHGMRPDEWSATWDAQNGLCYLCGQQLGARGHDVHVDHDHACCRNARSCGFCRRGLACGKCNVAIAMAGDDPERLRLMAAGLEVAKQAAASRIAQRPVSEPLWNEDR